MIKTSPNHDNAGMQKPAREIQLQALRHPQNERVPGGYLFSIISWNNLKQRIQCEILQPKYKLARELLLA